MYRTIFYTHRLSLNLKLKTKIVLMCISYKLQIPHKGNLENMFCRNVITIRPRQMLDRLAGTIKDGCTLVLLSNPRAPRVEPTLARLVETILIIIRSNTYRSSFRA